MDLRALRILIVDDNRHSVEIVKSVLASVGAREFRQASTAHAAFECMQKEPIDLVILDQNLGKGDEGIQLVRRVRNDPASPSPYVSILMLTGYTEHWRVTAARDAGVTDFLSKPFTVAGLLKRIEAMIFHMRPFVRSLNYFGPDRRRREDAGYTGAERRRKPTAEF
jgi:DNA-binding response OmpR family regulator